MTDHGSRDDSSYWSGGRQARRQGRCDLTTPRISSGSGRSVSRARQRYRTEMEARLMARRNGRPPTPVEAPQPDRREQYPSAPSAVEARRAWVAARTAFLSNGVKAPASGTFGGGKKGERDA